MMKKINVIVPLSRPKMLVNVIGNFERQSYPNKSLVIVQNGPGLGACQRLGFEPDVLIDIGKAHQSTAKNSALEYLRSRGESYFATFDDDDYYGPSYLEGIADGFNRGFDVVGKSAIFVRYSDGRMHYLEQEGDLCRVDLVNGPTISGAITADTPLFKEFIWGEDNDWVSMVRAMGAKIWASSRHGFCWMRHAAHEHNHTYRITDAGLENMTRALGPVYDCGMFDELVVNGVVEPSRFDRMPEQELSMDLHPVAQLWKEQKDDIHGIYSNRSGPPNDDHLEQQCERADDVHGVPALVDCNSPQL